jgi:hypothetical protein
VELQETCYSLSIKQGGRVQGACKFHTATVELMWLQVLLKELKIPHPHAARLWCDNLDASYLYANPVFHARMEHMRPIFHANPVFHARMKHIEANPVSRWTNETTRCRLASPVLR